MSKSRSNHSAASAGLLGSLVILFGLVISMPVSALNLWDLIIDATQSRATIDKAREQIKIISRGEASALMTGTTWTFTDAAGFPMKVIVYRNEICAERTSDTKVCVDFRGNETKRFGFSLLPDGTSEDLGITVNGAKIAIVSSKTECTRGQAVAWTSSDFSVGGKPGEIQTPKITRSSNGGLGGCS